MSIYSYDRNKSDISLQFLNQIEATGGLTGSRSGIPQAKKLIAVQNYQAALDALPEHSSDREIGNIKAVLLMRLGRFDQALNLLRRIVMDSVTMLPKPDVPERIQLNFATALLMTGHIAGCIGVIQTIADAENEQAVELRVDIRKWEKSLSVLAWLDWKACGIEHIKGQFPTTLSQLGRFDWEADGDTISDVPLSQQEKKVRHSHDLAC